MFEKQSSSVQQKDKGFTVKASPLNEVKLELGVALILGVVVFLVVPVLMPDLLSQLLLLAGYGVAAMGWIIWRVRRILRQMAQQELQNG